MYDSAVSDGLWGKCPDHHAPGIGPGECDDKDCHLDPGIYELVWGLHEAGIETGTSCQGGGPPHAYLDRVITLGHKDESAGLKARDVALALGMPLLWLHRVEWCAEWHADVEAGYFWWELHFSRWIRWARQKSLVALNTST